MRPIKAGLKTKMTLAFGTVFIVLAAVFNINAYHRLRAILVAEYNLSLSSRASSLLEKTNINPVIIPLPDKNNLIRVFYRSGSDVHIVFESPGIPAGLRTPDGPGVYDTLGMRFAYVRHSGRGFGEDNPGELLMITSDAPLQAQIRSMVNLLFLSSLFSVLIAGCFCWLVAGEMLRPLQRIIEAARSINANRLRDRIPVNSSGDELQELTETFNAMLQRIDESLRQQQNFFASASHELKTPLAILRTELELNLNHREQLPQTRLLLQSQLHEIKKLQENVSEFLVISQLKEGNLKLHPEFFDVSACILRVFNQLMPLLGARDIKPDIRFDHKVDSFSVKADEDKLSMVLINLVENASKYAAAGSVIACRIGKRPSGDGIRISIENRTVEEAVDTSFLREAFYRASNVQHGAGLGLWLCNAIVCLHGGTLTLRSAGHVFEVVVELPD